MHSHYSTAEHQIMQRKSLTQNLLAILLGAAAIGAVAATTGDEAIDHTTGSVPYVSGGVGKDSIDRLTTLSGKFNLKLVFALKAGDYVSDVKVTIGDDRGTSLLDTTSDGPWFLTNLPPGNYQIVATFAGVAQRRTVAVGAQKLNTVDFRWDSD
jgi:hypothetical protein